MWFQMLVYVLISAKLTAWPQAEANVVTAPKAYRPELSASNSDSVGQITFSGPERDITSG